MHFKEFLKKFNLKNLDKALTKFDKGMSEFKKTVKDFGDSMGSMTKEMSSDVEKSNKKSKLEAKKNQRNIDKLWGKPKSNTKIWLDKGKSGTKWQIKNGTGLKNKKRKNGFV